MKQVAGRVKLELAQYRELAAFAQFGSDLDPQTQAKLERGKRIVEIFKQPQYRPVPVEVQTAILWSAQNGHFDSIPVDKVKDCQAKLADYMMSRKGALMARIVKEKALNDALVADLKAAITEFKSTYR